MQSLRQKIYVSTIIDSFNYGTVMQAVATRDVLSAYGDPVFIDYYRPQWTPEGYRNLKLSGPGNPILKRLKYFLTRPQWERQRRMFRDFIERELPLCDAGPYLHGGEFDSDAVYCVGSDQTWNFEDNEGLDPVYFLVNVPDTCRKIAFSASFGRDVLGAEERDLTKEALSGFDAISVRESSSVALLESMGLRGVALKDPVLLCNPVLWGNLSNEEPAVGNPYILVYMLNENQNMIDYARRIAREEGFDIRLVTFSAKQQAMVPKGFRAEFQPTPARWLALFRDASYVVTDSFHGTCFSLIFEHPMTVFDPPKYSVRLTNVLRDFGLGNRRVEVGMEIEDINTHQQIIDWELVRADKYRFAHGARRFLDSCFRKGGDYGRW